MKKVISFAKGIGPSAIALALPAVALAYTPSTVPQANVGSLDDVLSVLCSVFTWAFYFLIVLAVIFVIVAAFKYLTAAGDPEKVKAAGSTLLYAAIAIGVALLARAVPLIVGNFLQAGTINSC